MCPVPMAPLAGSVSRVATRNWPLKLDASESGNDRVKPAASHVPSGTVDKAGLELSGPADGGIVVLQYDRACQASEGE
jgi:hypothetical protein